ncbi:MAG TPA: TIGR03915 family putative DNA repair protein, partial [Gemmatimonadaceae bacterium]|nr:TIGR03915 family putative DNA repair protein [Gemmatimonadaceae bacterium]
MAPDAVTWSDAGSASLLFGSEVISPKKSSDTVRVPRQFFSLVSSVACHRDLERWSKLYTLLWRLTHGENYLLAVASDPLVSTVVRMHRAVRRSAHKMKAFVRFKSVQRSDGAEEFVSWFEPAHRVVERTAPFFVDRFRSMRWQILTPDGCAAWDGHSLTLSEPVDRNSAPSGIDTLEDFWREYYAGIFNPARLNRNAMRAEMPKRYWKNLPEARLIDDLARSAPARVAEMIAQSLSLPQAIPVAVDVAESGNDHVSWHPVHDPGWREARRRAEAVTVNASAGIRVGASRVLTGVAGWTDPTLLLSGVFYPDDATTPEDRLRYYASVLPMVEVDATYYSLPSEEVSKRWVERTPEHFVFNIKAHSLMTGHPTNPERLPEWLREDLPLRLRIASNVYAHHFSMDALDELWRRFLRALAPLRAANKLGAIMLQYPRWFVPSGNAAQEIATARRRLNDWPASIEFRHRDWLSSRIAPRTFALLRQHGFAHVAVDSPPGMESSVPPVTEVTSPDLAM